MQTKTTILESGTVLHFSKSMNQQAFDHQKRVEQL